MKKFELQKLKWFLLGCVVTGAIFSQLSFISASIESISAILSSDITFKLNGKPIEFVEPSGAKLYPIIYKDRTYLPVRFVLEKTGGAKVDYDANTKTILLSTENSVTNTDTSSSIQPSYGGSPTPSVSSSNSSVSSGKSIYVSQNGNDESTGDLASPLKTIRQALELAEPGDSIVLQGGTYENQGEIKVEKPNITIMSKDGEWAVIKNPINDENIAMCFWFQPEASGCTLKNLEIIGGSYYAVKFESNWDWDKTSAFSTRYGCKNMLIENCKIHDTGADAVKLTPGCDDITIRECEIYNSGKVINDNAEGIDNVNADRMHVINCSVHDIATNGIYFKGGATDCVVESTSVKRCGEGGILMGFDTSIDWFDLEQNPNFYEAIRGTVKNCLVQDTNMDGIGFYATKDSKAYNNTLIDVAKTMHSGIYFGITLQDYDPVGKRPANVDPEVKNNIVRLTSGNNLAIGIRYSDELNGLSGLKDKAEIDNNCYYLKNGTVVFQDNRPGKEFEGGLSDWKNHISGDASSIESDPLLKSDGSLMNESPCKGMGVTDTSVFAK